MAELSEKLRKVMDRMALIPTPEEVFGQDVPKEIKKTYQEMRVFYDRYIAACLNYEMRDSKGHCGFHVGDKTEKSSSVPFCR